MTKGQAIAQSMRGAMSAKGNAEAPKLVKWKDFASMGTVTAKIHPDRAVYVQVTKLTAALQTRHGTFDNPTVTIAIDAETGQMLGDHIVGKLIPYTH